MRLSKLIVIICLFCSMLIILGCPGPKEYQSEEWLSQEIKKIDTLITSDNQDELLSHLIKTPMVFEGRIVTIATGADEEIENSVDRKSEKIIAVDTEKFRVIIGDRKLDDDIMSRLEISDRIRVYGVISYIDFLIKWPVRIIVLKKVKIEDIVEE